MKMPVLTFLEVLYPFVCRGLHLSACCVLFFFTAVQTADALPNTCRTDSPLLYTAQQERGFVKDSSAPFRPYIPVPTRTDVHEKRWVDSVYAALTEDERLGQLFVLRAHTDRDTAFENEVERLIRRYKPGGLCFFNPTHVGTVEKQAVLTNRYQSASGRLPLFISLDAEWGLGMRLRETTISYPRQMMLGAMSDNQMIYEMGLELARQFRRVGVNISFSPSADINNNSANPVINERSFGENRANVAAKCFQYMKGLQDGGVMACAKHFPGHGDTNVDSHYDLPLIPHDRHRLDSLELYPFRVLVEQGVGSFMVAHLSVPALDAREKRPTTLSRPVISDLLRNTLGFEGLIFTDAMEMKGVTKYYAPGEADVEALRAGNDMVLLPESIEAAIAAVKKALTEGSLSALEIETSVRRVLHQKYRLGLTRPQMVDMKNLRQELNTPQALVLKRRLIENCLTLVRDDKKIVGCTGLENRRYATLAIGDSNLTVFQKSCALYAGVRHYNLGKVFTPERELQIIDSVRQSDILLVSLHNMRSKASDNFGLTDQQINFIRRLCDVTSVGLTVFGNPYSLRYFDDIPTVLEAYSEDPFIQDISAQAWFGARDLVGKLPVTASKNAQYGQGIQKKWTAHRMRYDLPESVGMSSDTLRQLDSLMRVLINTGAAPGAQICIVKDNCVVWNKAYGYHTYDQTRPVDIQDLYDVASVTKVAATTVSVMHLQDAGKIRIDSAMRLYVPELKNTNKSNLKVREIMAHHAALQAWIPFYQQTLSPQKMPSPDIYHQTPSGDFTVPVAPNLSMNRAWKDSIWQQIFRSDLRTTKAYKYSDLGLYLCARAVQNLSGQPVNEYARASFYQPLGMNNTMFNPALCGIQYQCVPSEEDDYFRFGRLQGYVHDMGAAMLGGVSGHAGLFSSANDLAKLFQMLVSGGCYFDRQYISPSTLLDYTTRFPGSTRRGIGFDMKELNPKETMNMSDLAGENTFGHLGFTGTCVWADPDQQLVFVFLSNRTYPTMNNNKLTNENYRPRLQSIVYKAILPHPDRHR